MTNKIDVRSLFIKGSRFLVLLLLFLVFSIFTENFFSFSNWTNVGNILLQQAPFLMLLALSMTIAMIVGGIDLSIGSNISLSAFMCALVLRDVGSIPLAILAGLATGALIGMINGIFVAKVGLPPFVATYSMDWIAKGAVLVISKGAQINGFDSFRKLFNTWRGTYLLIAVVVIAVCWFLYSRTTYGRKTYCVGCNPAAAKLSGIKADKIMICTFAASGLIAAITGMMYIANLGAAEPTLGNNLRMQAMAAALIGGASFKGAKSKISNAVIGGLIIVVLNNGMIHIGIPGVWQDCAQGLIILAAIMLERGLEKLQTAKKPA